MSPSGDTHTRSACMSACACLRELVRVLHVSVRSHLLYPCLCALSMSPWMRSRPHPCALHVAADSKLFGVSLCDSARSLALAPCHSLCARSCSLALSISLDTRSLTLSTHDHVSAHTARSHSLSLSIQYVVTMSHGPPACAARARAGRSAYVLSYVHSKIRDTIRYFTKKRYHIILVSY